MHPHQCHKRNLFVSHWFSPWNWVIFFFFFSFGGEQGAIYALKKKKSKVPKMYSSTSTSFFHNNGMEGEDVGPRPLGACLT